MTDQTDHQDKQIKPLWQTRSNPGGVQKHETGITGFDEMLEGGLPKGRVTMVSAGPGCGKTVLLNEFIYRGATKCNEPGVFLTFEERPDDILTNLRNFNWSRLDEMVDSGKIAFVDAAPVQQGEIHLGDVDWLEPMLARIEYIAGKIGAKRLAVDNLNSIFLRYGMNASSDEMREHLFRFTDRIKALGLTTLISTESVNHKSSLSLYSVDEFVSEGLIELTSTAGVWGELRHMLVRKLRGCSYRSGSVEYDINENGIQVYPKIPVNSSVGDTDFSVRKNFGIARLDTALGGGIPEGHIMLVAGNTGTGKTTLALHFALEGLQQNEPVIWVALEEPVKIVLKTAAAHDWDLQAYTENDLLQFVTSPLLDVSPDKLLYKIIYTVNKTGAKRIIVDSISSLESAAMDKDAMRSFMLQLAGYAKTRGINVLLNYLSDSAFGAEKGQLLGSMLTNAMRLSSIVDGILILRYVERDHSVQKLLNILKLRGSEHDKSIFRFELGRAGFQVGDKFSSNNL